MKDTLVLHLNRASASYPIHIEQGLLQSDTLVRYCHQTGNRFAIITDSHLIDLYGNPLLEHLKNQNLEAILLSFPAGEHSKTRQTKEILEDALLQHQFGKDSCIIAIGGGIVTDLAGFVASTYCRGIPLIMIPTTLLGMVDASIGGKTAVNVPQGKNLIGTIYQPASIFIDPNCLSTLPPVEIRNGFSEMIKHGLILSLSYFELLENNRQNALGLDPVLMQTLIYQSCAIKQGVVQEDEFETGKRRLLNLGHTIGHAIETLTHHKVTHGQAVAVGLLGESYLSHILGYLSLQSFERIQRVVKDYDLLPSLAFDFKPEDFLKTMSLDKKAINQSPRFVLLEEIGTCLSFDGQYCSRVDPIHLMNVLEWTCKILRSH